MFPNPPIKNTDTPLNFPYQQAAFNRLCAIARATVYCNFENYIPPELSKRFGSQIVMLPRLLETDYIEMLDRILPSLPSHWRSRYEKLARAGIPEATRLAQGPRYFEELLLEVAVQERMEISSPVLQ